MSIAPDEEFARELESVENTVVKPIVRRKLHVSLFPNDMGKRNQDALDLVADIRLSLLAGIDKVDAADGEVRNLSAYAATVAFNACHEHFRARFPQRTRLHNKLLYLLTHEPDLARWRDASNRWLCSLAEWEKRVDHVQPPTDAVVDLGLIGTDRESSAALLRKYFNECGGPIFFDDLVNHVCAARGLIEPAESSEGLDAGPEQLSDPAVRIDSALEQTSRLASLWLAILELPLAHRKALLLNLRDGGGDNLLAALPMTGVASIRRIAEAVEMSFEELAEIWNSLPWDDNRIAEHLGLKRQQVINLRQTARVKLVRLQKESGNI